MGNSFVAPKTPLVTCTLKEWRDWEPVASDPQIGRDISSKRPCFSFVILKIMSVLKKREDERDVEDLFWLNFLKLFRSYLGWPIEFQNIGNLSICNLSCFQLFSKVSDPGKIVFIFFF